jgi:hypothetical protein
VPGLGVPSQSLELCRQGAGRFSAGSFRLNRAPSNRTFNLPRRSSAGRIVPGLLVFHLNSAGGGNLTGNFARDKILDRTTKVLRVLVAQMPMIHQAAALELIDIMDAADGMLRLIELGHVRLFVHPGWWVRAGGDGSMRFVERWKSAAETAPYRYFTT